MPIDEDTKQNLIVTLGLDKLPAGEQTEALLSIGRIIFESVLLRVLEDLSDVDRSEFEKLIDGGKDDEVIFAFLKGKVPGIEDIVREEVTRFQEESARFMKKID